MKTRISLWETVRKVGGDAIVLLLLLTGAIALLVPDSKVITAGITARMPGTNFTVWDEQELRRYDAPQVPAPAATYSLNDLDDLDCGPLYEPEAAWTEVHTAWPDYSVMYSVNAHVRGGEITIGLRTRQGYPRGYAYIDVLVSCRLRPGAVFWAAAFGNIFPDTRGEEPNNNQ